LYRDRRLRIVNTRVGDLEFPDFHPAQSSLLPHKMVRVMILLAGAIRALDEAAIVGALGLSLPQKERQDSPEQQGAEGSDPLMDVQRFLNYIFFVQLPQHMRLVRLATIAKMADDLLQDLDESQDTAQPKGSALGSPYESSGPSSEMLQGDVAPEDAATRDAAPAGGASPEGSVASDPSEDLA